MIMPMPSPAMIAKMILLVAGLRVVGYNEGVAAYYAPGMMEEVCERRVSNGWNDLDCSAVCLVSGIEPGHIGDWWLVYHPTLSYHLCHVVDCGSEADLPGLRAQGEVVEISWEMAQQAGWDGYQEGVRIWRLER